MGSSISIRGATPEPSMTSSIRPARVHGRRAAPSSVTASASPAGSSVASRSPSRWEQVIPAACMNVARPSSRAQSASQVIRSRAASSRGSPVPPASERVSGVVMFLRTALVPPVTSPGPANCAEASSAVW